MPFAGSLSGHHGPAYTDVQQGAEGDCYLIAALGAIAKSSRSAIQNMFLDNGDGTWTVGFWYGIARYVTVDHLAHEALELAGLRGGVAGFSFDPNNVLWVALAEKASPSGTRPAGKVARRPERL